MILKWNIGEKRTLNIHKKGTEHLEGVRPHPKYPSGTPLL